MPPDAAAILDAPPVAEVVQRSADPPVARAALERVVERHPQLAEELCSSPLVLNALVTVTVASRSLLAGVLADPATLDAVRDPDEFAAEWTVAEFGASLAAAPAEVDGVVDAARRLRRWKRRGLFRIAARDLLGASDLPTVGRELAALADVCLGEALLIARPEVPLAIIAMGKLGGRELNYASDVDVLFVHDGDSRLAERAARTLLGVMSTPGVDGLVFRTDADLRPEGRAGALTRSVEGFAAYYERWAQTWEFQALIKARRVAGDRALGTRFIELTEPYVWPEVLDASAIREIQAMKGRAEQELRKRGLEEREVKRGRGGIRDVEFSVQLLQLVHGRHDPSLRSANTLDALDALSAGAYVDAADAAELRGAYCFLRTVEHRLQLVDEQQTHTLPATVEARMRLARVLGYRDRGDETALDFFETDHRAHQNRVRSIHERLFFAPILQTLAGSGALPALAAAERLAAFGFTDVVQTRAALRELAHGLTRRSRVMQQLLPVILDWLSGTPDPDLGLLQLRRLVEGPARSASLAVTFRDSPGAAERACVLLGSSRMVGDALRRQPEFVEELADDEELAGEKTRADLVAEAVDTLAWRADEEQRRDGLRRFKRREFLRIAARDLLDFSDVAAVGRELSALGEACLEAALRALEPPVPFAVIALGRLGGGELSYASDLDVLFVYEGEGGKDFAAAERTATRLISDLGAPTPEGRTFVVDPNLRPEGKDGALARSLEGYAQYYERWALPWEFQALLRSRFVAGDVELGARFLSMVEPFVYRDPVSQNTVLEVRRMKARIERERIPPGEDPQFHLKLGKGSLSDVEWTVQLLQLVHGGAHPELRDASTNGALARLVAARWLSRDDERALAESYRFCERARNHRFLLSGGPGDSLPTGTVDAERLARMLGYVHRPQASLRDEYRRVTRRARRVFDRVFFGLS